MTFQLAQSLVTRNLFAAILDRIAGRRCSRQSSAGGMPPPESRGGRNSWRTLSR
jgi:hypothetical protein